MKKEKKKKPVSKKVKKKKEKKKKVKKEKKPVQYKTIKIRKFTLKEFIIRSSIILIVSALMYFVLFKISSDTEDFILNVNCFTTGIIQTIIIVLGYRLI